MKLNLATREATKYSLLLNILLISGSFAIDVFTGTVAGFHQIVNRFSYAALGVNVGICLVLYFSNKDQKKEAKRILHHIRGIVAEKRLDIINQKNNPRFENDEDNEVFLAQLNQEYLAVKNEYRRILAESKND